MYINVSDKAKPCPMCGSSQILIEVPQEIDRIYSLTISCADCGLRGFKNFLRSEVNPFTNGEQKLLDYWNNRKEG